MQSTKLTISFITVLILLATTACGTKITRALAPAVNSPGTANSNMQNTASTSGSSSASTNHIGSFNTDVGAKGVNKHVSPKEKQQAQNTIDEIANAVNQLH